MRFKPQQNWLEALRAGLKPEDFGLQARARGKQRLLFGLEGTLSPLKPVLRGLKADSIGLKGEEQVFKAESFPLKAEESALQPEVFGFDAEGKGLQGESFAGSLALVPRIARGFGWNQPTGSEASGLMIQSDHRKRPEETGHAHRPRRLSDFGVPRPCNRAKRTIPREEP